jgi:tetratricopeptide (TPR) repeat protein
MMPFNPKVRAAADSSFQLGLEAWARGERKEALRLFRRALRGNPRHAAAWNALALAALQRGRVKESEERFLRAVEAGRREFEIGAVDGLAARAVVLAAGKYLGGGITAGEEFEEPALGCDVAFQRFARTIDDPAAALILTDAERTEPQPVLAAGVRVDNRSRPLGAAGTVFSSAIFVAGSARAGVATATLGLGGAASDGWAAGESAAAHAGH